MKYEYKVKVITDEGSHMVTKDLDPLQNLFDEGWEYVGQIIQPLSSAGGTYSSSLKSLVAVVLKKEKEDLI